MKQTEFPFMDSTKPSITVNDAHAVVNLIDVIAARGAFRGTELSAVGELRSKFSGVIKTEEAIPTGQELLKG
jgi:hypothetical protein